jgi:hypothetical protein
MLMFSYYVITLFLIIIVKRKLKNGIYLVIDPGFMSVRVSNKASKTIGPPGKPEGNTTHMSALCSLTRDSLNGWLQYSCVCSLGLSARDDNCILKLYTITCKHNVYVIYDYAEIY